jgi:hypothetical protein
MVEHQHVLEKKQGLTEKIHGVFLESINFRKLNNLLFVNQNNHGRFKKKC